MRKVLENAKTLTPKSFWKMGLAVIHVPTALEAKRPMFKFIDRDRIDDLKAMLAGFVAGGVNYIVIYRKAKLMGVDWRTTMGVVGPLSNLTANGFSFLDNEEKKSRIRHVVRHAFLATNVSRGRELDNLPKSLLKAVDVLKVSKNKKIKKSKKQEPLSIIGEATDTVDPTINETGEVKTAA